MNVIAVESSTLARIAYDRTRELLQLEFNSHALYQYFGVPATVHEALLRAPSKGSYFNQAIRGEVPLQSDLQLPSKDAGAGHSGRASAVREIPCHVLSPLYRLAAGLLISSVSA